LHRRASSNAKRFASHALSFARSSTTPRKKIFSCGGYKHVRALPTPGVLKSESAAADIFPTDCAPARAVVRANTIKAIFATFLHPSFGDGKQAPFPSRTNDVVLLNGGCPYWKRNSGVGLRP
jgi:hypothetical protein